MDSLATDSAQTGDVHFLNLEYFFRVIYDTVVRGNVSAPYDLLATLAAFWNFLILLSILAAIYALIQLVYAHIRIHQIEEAERPNYATIDAELADDQVERSRWSHVLELIESGQESDWRQAIIEADIMLDDELGQLGYAGATLGDKLRGGKFRTIQEAGEAHGVRNSIAHQGSTFKLDNHLAYRTIKKYEAVFVDLGVIPPPHVGTASHSTPGALPGQH